MTANPNLVHIGDGPILPIRSGSGMACGFRLARHNGELVFQAGYQWTFGVEWSDIPIVDLDEDASHD